MFNVGSDLTARVGAAVWTHDDYRTSLERLLYKIVDVVADQRRGCPMECVREEWPALASPRHK